MRIKYFYVFLVLTLTISLTAASFSTNFAHSALPQDSGSIAADLPSAALENEGGITLEIDPNSGDNKSACPGSMVNYFLKVTNSTGDEETITLSASDNLWLTAIDPPSLTLPADGYDYDYIEVTVEIPLTANAGDQDTVMITAVGDTSGLSDSANLTTIVAVAQGWLDYEDSPAERGTRNHALVYWDGKLYKIGGYGYVSAVAGSRPWLDIYDITSDTWSQGADMPAGRHWIDCEAIDLTGAHPKIYCAGGYLSTGRNTLYIYDINTNTWSTGAALPENRYNYASVVHNNLYFVIGGYTSDYTNTMLVYNPATNTWDSSKASMTVARGYFSAGLIGEKIYAAGGYNGALLSSMEIYDIDAGTWAAGPDLLTPWVNAADGVVNNRFLLLAGGSETSTAGATNRAHVYDAVQERWSLLPTFIHAIYGSEGGGDGEDFWVVSGRMYEDTFQNSTYTTKMVPCEGGVCVPVSGPDFTWDPLTPVAGSAVSFTATVTGGTLPISYAWDFGDGSTGIGVSPEHTFASSGTYTVTLTVSNCGGSATETKSYQVTVGEACVPVSGPDFTWDPLTPVAGSAVSFTATVTGGTLPISYAWDFGDGSTGSGVSPDHTFTSSGTYTVRLTVSNCSGNGTASKSHEVTVSPVDTTVYIFLPLVFR